MALNSEFPDLSVDWLASVFPAACLSAKAGCARGKGPGLQRAGARCLCLVERRMRGPRFGLGVQRRRGRSCTASNPPPAPTPPPCSPGFRAAARDLLKQREKAAAEARTAHRSARGATRVARSASGLLGPWAAWQAMLAAPSPDLVVCTQCHKVMLADTAAEHGRSCLEATRRQAELADAGRGGVPGAKRARSDSAEPQPRWGLRPSPPGETREGRLGKGGEEMEGGGRRKGRGEMGRALGAWSSPPQRARRDAGDRERSPPPSRARSLWPLLPCSTLGGPAGRPSEQPGAGGPSGGATPALRHAAAPPP